MRIEDLLRYDSETGHVFWKVSRRNGTLAGSRAGTLSANRYRYILAMGKKITEHRIAWYLYHGEWPDGQIDHINGIRDDNRIENLRDVSRQQNGMNQKLPTRSSSGIMGVYYRPDRNKYVANIMFKGKSYNLGHFTDKFEAARARALANLHFGFHPNHGRAS